MREKRKMHTVLTENVNKYPTIQNRDKLVVSWQKQRPMSTVHRTCKIRLNWYTHGKKRKMPILSD
jgi:hypothetical protein